MYLHHYQDKLDFLSSLKDSEEPFPKQGVNLPKRMIYMMQKFGLLKYPFVIVNGLLDAIGRSYSTVR